MLTCHEVSRDLAADGPRSAGLRRRLGIWAHLLMCDRCQRFSQQIEALGVAVRGLARTTKRSSADAASEERLLARIAESINSGEDGP